MTDELLVPEGTRLMHIGPHKTGSTALQGAFHRSRADLLEQGVRYAGSRRHEVAAVHWAMGFENGPLGGGSHGQRRWKKLVREVRSASEPRVVISSETFCSARPPRIATLAEALGPDGVHAVITIRPLVKILPSQWQQSVQNGLRKPYEDWLAELLHEDSDTSFKRRFWRRQRHDLLACRWASVLGEDQVTVLALDPADHAFLPRTFERMLGLRDGTLAMRSDLQNRSLTWPEVELLRRFNEEYDARGLPVAFRDRLMRSGGGRYLKGRTPAQEEGPIPTPQWARDRAAEIGAEIVEGLATSGVRVVGRTDGLAERTTASERAVPTEVGIDVAVRLALAALTEPGPGYADPAEESDSDGPLAGRAAIADRLRRRRPR